MSYLIKGLRGYISENGGWTRTHRGAQRYPYLVIARAIRAKYLDLNLVVVRLISKKPALVPKAFLFRRTGSQLYMKDWSPFRGWTWTIEKEHADVFTDINMDIQVGQRGVNVPEGEYEAVS